MTLLELNNASLNEAKEALIKCCGSTYWAKNILRERPFQSKSDLLAKSDISWNTCTDVDALEAFSHHPKIGSVSNLEKKFASTAKWAKNEQQSVKKANKETIAKLAIGNKKYEAKFGYIFIVFASGKSAEEMLDLLENRLKNSAAKEIVIAKREQNKITKLRLEKLLE